MLGTRIAKFGLVGILNTLIDFGIFNVLSSKRFKLTKIQANLISTTAAMIFSFFANKRFVFSTQGGNFWLQALSFYLITAFGLYVLQNLVIHILTKKWTFFPDLAKKIVRAVGIKKSLINDDFIIKNTAKLAGTAVSLTWNFLLLQYVVFHP